MHTLHKVLEVLASCGNVCIVMPLRLSSIAEHISGLVP